MLAVLSKLFEKFIYDQLYQYQERGGLLTSDESGFRALQSSATCLPKCKDDWYSGMDEGLLICLTSIDLKKAFDTVDHEILCRKLEHYVVVGKELSWFKSYLSNRKQYCRLNGVDSNVNDINGCVSQGSCLGPLLFLIYINDLPCIVKCSKVSMYADHTIVHHSSRDIAQLNAVLNEELRRLDGLLKGIRLSLNVAKTHSMLISTKQKTKYLTAANQALQSSISEEHIALICNTTYLGVQIDENLAWKNKIKSITEKASRAIGFLKFAKHFLPDTDNTDLRLPLRSSANGQKCFSFRGETCWNGLSTEEKLNTLLKAFKCLA